MKNFTIELVGMRRHPWYWPFGKGKPIRIYVNKRLTVSFKQLGSPDPILVSCFATNGGTLTTTMHDDRSDIDNAAGGYEKIRFKKVSQVPHRLGRRKR